eukprot:TRINITY_DN5859_c0_g1_i2.p1 TRINITY_DN5859_c0_g1~~TRINITY_DN5859_c0_g1_i2.p1  ORF type:complete len:567 (+),score=86.39 TRINITY_DN5859_c0_g1_i2:40-1740(+)
MGAGFVVGTCDGCSLPEEAAEGLVETLDVAANSYFPIGPLYQPGGLVLVNAIGGRNSSRLPFSDAYEIHPKSLGVGSFGSVFTATHRRTGAIRAMKAVFKDGRSGGHLRAHLEGQLLARFDHPNVVRVYEVIESEVRIYLVMEFCQGGDLIEFCNSVRSGLSEFVMAVLVWQMLSALQHVHARGVVHRDVKPEHFLLLHRISDHSLFARGSVEEGHPVDATLKLVDFGLARSSDDGSPLTPRCGTPAYMPPEAHEEQCTQERLDRCDMWAIGVIVHCLVSGTYPGLQLMELTAEQYFSEKCWAHASATSKDLIWQLLHPDPQKRLSVIAAFRHPWFTAVDTFRRHNLIVSMWGFSEMLRTFADMPRLWQLAMVVAAREIDARALGCAGLLYQDLEVACEGAATRQALRAISGKLEGPIGDVVADLLPMFDYIDMDGSDTLHFSVLAAVFLGSQSATVGDASVAVHETYRWPDDICLRVFDFFGQGCDEVSGAMLDQLLFPTEACHYSDAHEDGVDACRTNARVSAQIFDQMVKELEGTETIGAVRFREMFQSRIAFGTTFRDSVDA